MSRFLLLTKQKHVGLHQMLYNLSHHTFKQCRHAHFLHNLNASECVYSWVIWYISRLFISGCEWCINYRRIVASPFCLKLAEVRVLRRMATWIERPGGFKSILNISSILVVTEVGWPLLLTDITWTSVFVLAAVRPALSSATLIFTRLDWSAEGIL